MFSDNLDQELVLALNPHAADFDIRKIADDPGGHSVADALFSYGSMWTVLMPSRPARAGPPLVRRSILDNPMDAHIHKPKPTYHRNGDSGEVSDLG
jgi:hypothetical protein